MAVLTHPDHAQIAQMVKDWFHLPFQSMGYSARQRGWGTYWNNAQVYVSGFPIDQTDTFLAELRSYYRNQPQPISIYIDDKAADAKLGPALIEAGCTRDKPEIFLIHGGSSLPSSKISGLDIKPVSEADLYDFAYTRLRAFAESEDAPDPARLSNEIARRKAELAGTGRGMLAKMDGQSAGIIWWHQEPQDIWVKYVGVRVPFRKRGIARELLRKCIADAYELGFRSIVINVLTDNIKAIQIYQHLGFQDEVYWRRCYILES